MLSTGTPRLFVVRARLLAAFAAALLAAPAATQAQTYTWNNNTGTSASPGLWSTATNWSGMAVPTFGTDVQLVFPSSISQPAPTYTMTNDANAIVNQLTFALDGYTFVPAFASTAAATLNVGGVPAQYLTFSTSSAMVAPSIVQNGNGSVLLASNGSGGVFNNGTNALQLNGTGLGVVRIDAPIGDGGGPTGLNINFAASAVKPFNSGASLILGTDNTFNGNVTLNSGNLAIATSMGLGNASNQLIINPGTNSLRFVTPASPTAPITIANPVVLNGTMTISGADSGTANFTGGISGVGGITVNNLLTVANIGGFSPAYINIQSPATFAGPLIVKPMVGGFGVGGSNAVSVSGVSGSLTTTNIQLYPAGYLSLDNTAGNATRLAAGTTISSYRGFVGLFANASADASETIATLNASGWTGLYAIPSAGGGSQITVTTLNRPQNGTVEFRGTGLGGTPGANVANIYITNNPGGATPGSTTPGTQNLAVLPYAFGNSVASTASTAVPAISLLRYDSASQQIVPLNTNTEYANALTLAAGTTPGLNYYLSGGANAGVVVNNSSTVNGIVLIADTSSTVSPTVFPSIGGSATLTVTGPIVFTGIGSNTPSASSATFMPSQISVGTLAFGASTAYIHASFLTLGNFNYIATPMTGSGGLVKSGQSDVTLFGTNAISGGMTINSGNIVFDADPQLGAAGGAITLNSGNSDGLTFLPNIRFTTSNATGVTIFRPLTLGPGGGTLTVAGGTAPLTYSGAITGSGSLFKGGAGTLNLNSTSNTATGDVVAGGGTLVPASDAALGASTNRVILNGGTFQPGASYTSTNRDFLNGSLAGGTFYAASGDFTISGTLAQQLFSTTTVGASLAGFTKIGTGNLTLTNSSTLTGSVTIGEATASSGSARYSTPNAMQVGGALTLSGAKGAMALASSFVMNDGTSLVLDNSGVAGNINNDRVGTVPITLNGAAVTLIGNANGNVSELTGNLLSSSGGFVGGNATVTINQPTSAGGQVTTLASTYVGTFDGNTGLPVSAVTGNSTLFVRGTNLGGASGDRSQYLIGMNLPSAGGIAIGVVAAASATSAPTDFATTVAVGSQFSILPLPAASYGSLAAPGAAVTADQPTSTFTLAGATSLNALRIRDGGGVALAGQTLQLGDPTTANLQAGMILSTGTANAGITGSGTIEFGTQSARIITPTDLTIGSAANPVALQQNNTLTTASATAVLVKTGAGTLTLYGVPSVTNGQIGTTVGTFVSGTSRVDNSVNVGEGKLVLGNAFALGQSYSTSTTAVNGALPNISINSGATLDINNQTLLISAVVGAGTFALGSGAAYIGQNSNFSGQITGTTTSKYIIGYPQALVPSNTYGSGQNMIFTGDNTNFLGTYQNLEGVLQFRSAKALGGASSIILGDTDGPNSGTRSATVVFSDLGTSYTTAITVPAMTLHGTATAAGTALIIGNESANGIMTLNGSITLNRNASIGASNGSGHGGMFTVASFITGPGQLIINPNTTFAFSGGNIAFTNPNNNYLGGTLLNEAASGSVAVNCVVAIGADTALSSGPITLDNQPGLLRADGGARALANPINVNPSTSATTRSVQFGFVGVNDFTLAGPMSSTLANPAAAQVVNLIVDDFSTGNATFAGTITNGSAPNIALGMTKNGPGTLILSGTGNTFSGPFVMNSGTLGVGANNALGTGPVTVNGGTIKSTGSNWSINNTMTGTGNLIIEGPNTLTLAGASTVAGTTQVNSGTLKIGSSTALGLPINVTQTTANVAANTVVLSGAVLDLNGQQTIHEPIVLNGSGIGGTGALINSLVGTPARIGTGISSLTITSAGGGSNLGATVSITGGNGASATAAASLGLTQAAINAGLSGGTYGTSGPFSVTISAPPAGGTQATATLTYNSALHTVTAITLTNPGSGYVTVPTFSFSGGNAPSPAASVSYSSVGSFQLTGVTLTATGAGYTGTPTASLSTGTSTLTANPSSVTLATTTSIGGVGDIIIDGQVLGTGALTKVGTGTVTLTATNSYSGGTVLNAGVMSVSADANLGAGAGGLTFNGGTLQVTGTTFTSTPRTIAWGASGGAFDINSAANTFAVSQNLTAGGPLTKLGAGTLVLGGANTYTGGTTINAGELSASADTNLGNAAGGLSINGGILRVTGTTYTTTARAITWGAAGGGFDIASAANTFTLNQNLTGGGPLTKLGAGKLVLAGTNTYVGGTTVTNGVLAVSSDAALGNPTVGVTVGAFGTLLYNGTTSTTRSFTLNSGALAVAAGQTLTLTGSQVAGGFLTGPGTFATSASSGASFAGATSRSSSTVNSNSGLDLFINYSNGGALNVAAGLPTPVTAIGFTNQGSGAVTIGAVSVVNVADFQSYGTLTINPAVVGSGQFTEMVNTGTSPLTFDGGSRTFLGTPATANSGSPPAPTFVAGIDLHGQNAVVAGGLFVNNGFVVDSSNNGMGTSTIIADFGALVKGAGFFQNPVITQNGGRVQAGNSPGSASFGRFVFGPGGVSNYVFAIDDATGTAGPSPDAAGHVSGWGLINSVRQTFGATTTSGDFTWTATPTDKLTVAIDTLVNPTTVGTDVAGAMADFDPTHAYSWPAASWAGNYAGPTDAAALNAATSFDTSGFLNPVAGTFGWSLDPTGQTLSLLYTPSAVPEPGTLALTGSVLAIGWVRFWRRRWQSSGRATTPSA